MMRGEAAGRAAHRDTCAARVRMSARPSCDDRDRTLDAIAIRPVGVLAQSFDHRAIDGGYSAAFLDRLPKIVEQTDWSREI